MAVEENDLDTRQMVQQHNRKNKKSGGFQSMGLSRPVFQGILKKGYKVPTPIQRKSIPLILEGRDVVAMARTGSGKTAAFLIPLFEKLQARNPSSGARALILSPTRELALQTQKFFKELAKLTGLKSTLVLGGDSMEKQFSRIHENPDVLIATPGRFVHLCVEMSLKLLSVQYVVFDEADRLFELGFGEQLREILGRLPDDRQTVLFSATLPKLLVDFAKAGLNDPTLLRLDVESKIPETLKLAHFYCRAESKDALLLHLLQDVIVSGEQTIVFFATRHHVEYAHTLLEIAGIPNTFIYSQLDSSARKINTAKFQMKKVSVLLVTDLAARGIDVPHLDHVINYHFPPKAKLFIHRVGRAARAGRRGTAYTMISQDELPYYIDLQLFFGNSPTLITGNDDTNWHNKLGIIPQMIQDDYADQLKHYFDMSSDLLTLKKVGANGYLQYLKSRPGASNESAKRVKTFDTSSIGIHPILNLGSRSALDVQKAQMIQQMKGFRPPSTIFEIGNTAKNVSAKATMYVKRHKHESVIEKFHSKKIIPCELPVRELEESSVDDINSVFGTIIQPKKAKEFKVSFSSSKKTKRDDENYIPYQAKDHHTEAGYSMMNPFEAQASGAMLDIAGDDETSLRKKRNLMRWDMKSRKYVKAEGDDKKKIKTESGAWIPASYKSDRYKKWKERSKLAATLESNHDDEEKGIKNDFSATNTKRKTGPLPENHPAMKKARNAVPAHKKGPRNEILRPEQILKKRKEENKKRFKNSKKGRKGGGGKKRH